MDKSVLGAGDVVGGRYLVEGVIGQGGMAIVYRARNTATDGVCALKVILPHLAARPGVVQRFAKEARVGGKIGACPHIVTVMDAGLDEQRGVAFLVMELLQGETLQEMIGRGPVKREVVRVLMDQLAEALEQAHSASVVHRDLKPSNLFVTRDRKGREHLKVLDFGIAKVLEGELHKTATEIGTPAYAAPEQLGPTFRRIAAAQGVSVAEQVSEATDLWAVGLIAYEALTGHGPGQYWGATTASDLPLQMALALRGGEAASARAGERAGLLPVGFDGWFARCTQIDASRRWGSAGEAMAELERVLAGGGVPAAAVSGAPIAQTSLAGVVQEYGGAPRAPAVGQAPESRDVNARGVVETNLGAQVSTLVAEAREERVAGPRRVPVWGFAAGVGAVALVGVVIGVVGGTSDQGKGASEAAARDKVTGEMVKILAGTFQMGSTDGSSDEKPVHEVKVDAFELDRTEVTVSAYKACVDAGKCTNPGTGSSCNWGVEGKEQHPINCIDWNQATAYCAWAGKRLPTEEEWEYAARGTEGRKYPWGSAEPESQLCWKKGDGTCVVGSYPSGDSPLGLKDLLGNVWEWTASGYSENYSKNRANDRRVFRGGSWSYNDASNVRSAFRLWNNPSNRGDVVGFRCARP